MHYVNNQTKKTQSCNVIRNNVFIFNFHWTQIYKLEITVLPLNKKRLFKTTFKIKRRKIENLKYIFFTLMERYLLNTISESLFQHC